MTAPSFRAGAWRVTVLDAGPLLIDGGAMHGVVPKVLWSRQNPADELNRIRMTHRVLLLEGHGKRVLVEAGSGAKGDARWRARHGLPESDALLAALAGAGVAPESVDLVLASHLHFDHVGGATRLDADGAVVPTFPRARLVAQRKEVEDALAPHERNRASYLTDENVLPLRDRIDAVDGRAEVAPGLLLEPTPGHTPGHQSVRLEGEVRGLEGADGAPGAWFLGDLVPTAAHVRLPWIMAFDLYPLETLATKRRVLGEVADSGALVVLDHDAGAGVARVARDGADFAVARRWPL